MTFDGTFLPVHTDGAQAVTVGSDMDKAAVGRRISLQRGLARLSQREVAERVGVTVRQYQRWEYGESLPYWRHMTSLAEVLGVEMGDLLQGPGETEPPDWVDLQRQVEEIRSTQKLILEELRRLGGSDMNTS